MSTQLILTIIFIFLSFFVLQSLLNFQFFQNYYTEREFNKIHVQLIDYVEKMNDEDADLYDEMHEFTNLTNASSIVVGRDYRLLSSAYSDYTIEVQDVSSNTVYKVRVPENDYTYGIGEIITVDVFEHNEDLYNPVRIVAVGNTSYTYSSEIQCDDDCFTISGPVITISKPTNLNARFENSNIVQQEINKLRTEAIDLLENEYAYGDETGYWYSSSYESTDVLVFIHDLDNFDFIITIIQIENTSDIIQIVSSYNNYVYLTAIVIIFLWSFRLSSIISKPIQNIELVAREIADLNFNVEAHEYNNRENTSLSRSINLISRNLKETLHTLSYKNDELRNLYDEQVKQVSLKKQLVSSISHELKTPLMIMQVTIQGILDGIIEKEDEESELTNVLDEINKSSLMISDMLQIYRLENANTQLELSEFNLSKVIHFFIKDFENILKKHKLKLDLNLDNDVFIEADNKLIKRVISNFFTNAIKYTPDGQKIYIEVSETEDQIYFELTNHGVIINDDDLENIWIPFFRSQTEVNQRIKSKGSGIGLYLVSEVLKAHRAEFGIENIDNGVRAFFRINKKQTL